MLIRIGVLVAGEPPEELRGKYADYGEMARALLATGEAELEFTSYAVRNDEFPASADAHDAWLITGSRFSAYDDLPWIKRLAAFIRELDARRRPLIGICFGHQLIAEALGGKVERARAGWGVGVHAWHIDKPASWMDGVAGDFALVASHQDQVTQLPPGAERIAGSDFCPIAMYHIGDHVFAMQAHPEFTRQYSRELMEVRRGLIGDERIDRGMASLQHEVDADTVAHWMLKFLEQGVGKR